MAPLHQGTAAALIGLLLGLDKTIGTASLTLLAIAAWATALSFQHVRHVIRGPITSRVLETEAHRQALRTTPIFQRS